MSAELTVQTRDVKGSRQSRRLRHNGAIPGIIYGAGSEPVMISVTEKEITRECENPLFFNRLLSIIIGEKKTVEKVLPKKVTRHAVSGDILHVDFMRVSKDKKVKISIPVETINEDKSPGIKKGGIINLVVHKLECLCVPESIPEKIILDLNGKEIGDSFLLEQIDLPKGVSATNPERDGVLATIVVSKVGKEEDKAVTVAATAESTEATAEQKQKSE